MGEKLTDMFLQLFCEKNSDGSKKLRLKGKDLYQRIGDRIISSDMEKICVFLENHPEVNEVNLCYNEIGDEGLAILCELIFNYPNNLLHLNLMHCDITAEGMRSLFFTSKEDFVMLKTLRLAGNKLGPTGGYMTALFVEHCPTLEHLDLGDTDQTADSIDCLFLQVYRSQIKILNVSRPIPNSSLYQVDVTFLGTSISELLRVNDTIREIHAQKCDFDGHDVEMLLNGLRQNTSLRLLDIANNNIRCFGVELLADWLKTRPNLLGLNISGNKVKNHGATGLSFGMPFSKLRYLDISYNEIGDEGMIDVLNSIKKPYMLRYFYFWGNLFGHRTNKVLDRMLLSTVFQQECIDVKVYCVDKVLCAARYPADKYKHRYYEVMDHGCPVELKIKRNKIEQEGAKPRALIKFEHMDRFPKLE